MFQPRRSFPLLHRSLIFSCSINIGLYRDDGLAICDKTPFETENIKKEICKIFKENNLSITIEANKKIIDFLDITMNLKTGEHKPYMKPNNTPLYVHKQSNHPPNIIKNIPESINVNRRLSNISPNEKIFKKAIPPYQDALKKADMVAHGRMVTSSRQITEVKQRRARLVLGWVTAARVTLPV